MKLLNTLLLGLSFVFNHLVDAETFSYKAGAAYCAIAHPIELVFKLGKKASTFEEQHVIQQQAGGIRIYKNSLESELSGMFRELSTLQVRT